MICNLLTIAERQHLKMKGHWSNGILTSHSHKEQAKEELVSLGEGYRPVVAASYVLGRLR